MRLSSFIVLSVLAAAAACSSFDSAEPTPELPERDASLAPDAGADAGEVGDAALTDAAPSASAAYGAAVLFDAPIAYWRFAEPAGSAVLSSETGEHVLLPAANAPALGATGVFGAGSGALSFDGKLGRRVACSTMPANALPFAFEAWVFPVGSPDVTRAIVRRSAGGASFNVRFTDTSVRVDTGMSDLGYAVAGPMPPAASWHHLLVQATTAEDAQLYIDGVKYGVPGVTNNGTLPMVDFSVGAMDAELSPADGTKIAEVALYDHVLDPTRITAHYLSGKPPSP